MSPPKGGNFAEIRKFSVANTHNGRPTDLYSKIRPSIEISNRGFRILSQGTIRLTVLRLSVAFDFRIDGCGKFEQRKLFVHVEVFFFLEKNWVFISEKPIHYVSVYWNLITLFFYFCSFRFFDIIVFLFK